MAIGHGNTRGGEHQRGTLRPTQKEYVYIEYTTGVKIWATPSVAERAIARGEAKRATPPKNGEAKKI